MQVDLQKPVWTPLDELTEEEAKDELRNLRNAWDWVDPKVKYFAVHGGTDCVLVTRQYKRLYGQLGVVTFLPDEVTALVSNREWNPVANQSFDEIKQVVVGYGQLTNIEFTIESEAVVDALVNGGVSDEIARSLIGSIDEGEAST